MRKYIFFVFLVILLMIGNILFSSNKFTKVESIPPVSVPSQMATQYALEYFGDSRPGDAQITKISGQTIEILVPSIKAALPELQSEKMRTLVLISSSTDTKKIFFSSTLKDSDSGIFDLYSFNVASRQFNKLSFPAKQFVLSPNKQFVAGVSTEGVSFENLIDTVFIFSLDDNRIISSTILPMSETATSWNGFDVPFIKWKNVYTLEYDAYRKANISGNSLPTQLPFETRQLQLK
ncbi:MAG: hypothetical protein Q7K40_00845 [bacterium]|nr:hypothetical protein [bacterium]